MPKKDKLFQAQPYSEKFLTAWKHYPHFEARSIKMASYQVWIKQDYEKEENYIRLMAWINYMKTTQDWRKDSGKFVPGLQVFLKRPDVQLEEPPRPMQPRVKQAPGGAFRSPQGMIVPTENEVAEYRAWLRENDLKPSMANLKAWEGQQANDSQG